MANNTAVLRKKQRRKQPERTLTSPVIWRKQPQRRRKQRKETLRWLSQHHLPFDLVEEILCRLPVKQLIQLRCVCKSWNSLISNNSNFAKKHLRLSASNQGRHHLNLKGSQFLNFESPISAIFFNSSRDATLSSYSIREILKIGEPDRDPGGYVSTCDGILCYQLDKYSALLINPSIRKFIVLPPLKFPDQKHALISYTLVYDRFINNYKIIALNAFLKYTVHTLALGTDYWRRTIQDFPSFDEFIHSSTGIFVNDSVNWLTSWFIVSLDLEKESYQKLSLPANVQFKSNYLSGTLGTLRGCLSLLVFTKDNFSNVWIMKEFGNEKSWTKLLSIPYMKLWGASRYTKLLYVSEDDQVLMEVFIKMSFRLVVYDSINNTFNFPEFQNKIHMTWPPEVYVESLISPF